MDEPTNDNNDTLDIDQLIKAAQSDSISETLSSSIDPIQVEIRDFIRERGIKPSKSYIPLELIYYYYTEYSPNPVTRHKFISIFSHYFTKKKITGILCCRINPESIGLPDYYSIYKDPAFSKSQRKFISSYEGVYKVSGFYISRIKLEDGLHYLGRFKTDREAAMEYDKQALHHLGPTAKLNFPERIKDYEQEIKEEE